LSSADERALSELAATAAVRSERCVSWFRLPAIALVAASLSLPHEHRSHVAVAATLALALVYAAVALVWSYTRNVTDRFSVVATILDVAVVTALVGVCGGAFSEARWAYSLIPALVVFRAQPVLAAGAGAAAVVAFLAQGVEDANGRDHAARLVAVHSGYLILLTAAATVLASVLRGRMERVAELLGARRRLLAEALSAEARERRTLAESLHDEAIGTLVAARQDLAAVAGGGREHDPAVERADAAVRSTIATLREAVLRLHPSVREEAGFDQALRSLGAHAARRGRFELELDVRDGFGHAHEALLLGAARELLANAAEHAHAANVSLRVFEDGHELVLRVSDDGAGFDERLARDRLATGHIGLASQRARVESVGGRLAVRSTPGRGTTVEVRVPA
jgi:two-component system, NarL family, sensor kinase